MTNKSLFVTKLNLAIADELRKGLIEKDFEITQPAYTLFCGKKKGLTCTLYTSGKLVVQGKLCAEFVEFYLEPEILKGFSFGYESALLDTSPHIGQDESGKGDYFGPLCIAGVFANEEQIRKLHELGVADSKTLTEKKMAALSREIKKICPFEVIKIFPQKYNELYAKFKNLNRLLGWAHAKVAETLYERTQCKRILIDQFARKELMEGMLKSKPFELEQRTHAESDPVVAAASILARTAFTKAMVQLEEEFEVTLPLGASKKVIECGKTFLYKFGKEPLKKVAKLHFKTTEQILS